MPDDTPDAADPDEQPPPALTGAPEAAIGDAPLSPPLGVTRRRYVWFELTAVLCVYLVPAVWSSIRTYFVQPPPEGWSPERTISRLVQAFQGIVPVLFLMFASREPLARFGLVRPRLSHLVVGGALLMGAPMAANAIFAHWSALGPTRHWARETVPHALGNRALFASAIVATAAAEEFVCRGYLIPRLEDLTRSTGASLFLSAILFASFHAYQGPARIVETFVVGLIYGVAFCVSRSLAPLVVGHAAHNLWVYFR